MIVLLSLLNAFVVSLGNVLGGLAARSMPLPSVMLLAAPSALCVALVAAIPGNGAPSPHGMALGMLAGAVGGAGVPLVYRALALGPVGVAATIVACVSTAIVATTGMVTGSAVTPLRLLGLILCGAAILLVSAWGSRQLRGSASGLLFATSAGLAFGFFAVMMNAARSEEGWWPLVAARLGVVFVALVMLGVMARRSRTGLAGRVALRGGPMVAAVAAGVLDVTGNLFLILALREGDLLLVAVVTSVAPAIAATLGWLILRERLTALQLSGIAAAVIAVAVTAL